MPIELGGAVKASHKDGGVEHLCMSNGESRGSRGGGQVGIAETRRDGREPKWIERWEPWTERDLNTRGRYGPLQGQGRDEPKA